MKPPAPAIVGLLLLSLARLGHAQNQPRYRLPCAQVVRLGLDRYVAQYTAATHDDSTAGNIEACDAYARCRRSVSDAEARALSPTRRDQIAQVRRDLDALAEACDEYTYISAGGGTMWSQMSAGAHAVREDFYAALVSSLRRPVSPSRTARRQADAALENAQRSLAGLRTLQNSGASTMDRSLLSAYRNRTYPAARAAFVRLQTLLPSLPDASALRVARETRQELAAPEQNLKSDR